METMAHVAPVLRPVPGQTVKNKRIHSIDLLRGAVMIIMMLDHVRDYFHADAFQYNPTDLSHTNGALFFTRWITHFCAPVFTFLAGASARLNGAKKSNKELSYFLLTRGLWLVVAEMAIVTLGWTFNPQYPVLILQVIWALGVSMMVLSVMIFLPETVILVTGLLLIFGHNLLDYVTPGNGMPSFLWATLHQQRFFAMHPFAIMMGYPVTPWIGIMLTGYVFGKLYFSTVNAAKRKTTLIYLGIAATVFFIVIRFLNAYGDPSHWSVQKTGWFTFMSFLNVTKYPPSLLYILMTLGPALLFLAFAEKPLNTFTEKIVTIGRVPMFFYLVHIFVIHALAMAALVLTGHRWSDMVVNTWVSNYAPLKGYGFNLAVVYIIWMLLAVALYPLCKWFDAYKRTYREKWWLSYI